MKTTTMTATTTTTTTATTTLHPSCCLIILLCLSIIATTTAFTSNNANLAPALQRQSASFFFRSNPKKSSDDHDLHLLNGLYMSDPKVGADEAAELLERAKKLREEAAQMSGANENETEQQQGKSKAVVSADGTFYDDEVDPGKKETLSSDMRARLIREASTGLDSESKNTNVILYISVVVAILVALGGQGECLLCSLNVVYVVYSCSCTIILH